MSKLDHRPSEREASSVVRNLRLTQVNNHNRDTLMIEIDHLFGVDEVDFNDHDATIYLAYDATQISLEGIQNVIRKHGADIHDDWWTHTKESYYHFIDKNIKDNAEHKPSSCHKAPPRVGQRHK